MVPQPGTTVDHVKYVTLPQSDGPVSLNDTDVIIDESDAKLLDFDEQTTVVVPPDGGWGWMVVFASFMCNMIVDGIIFSFGIFINPMAATYNVSKPHVALVGSLMSGFYLIVGPFASALANRYGFRTVAVIGSVLGSLAFALSYFANSVEFLCVTYGVLGGIGFGFIYVPAVITVGFYFERWRALATGIGVCGSGIGTFLFAPITDSLVRSLGWRQALLCQGAIVLTCLGFGAIFRPIKSTKVKDIKADKAVKELIMDPSLLPPKTKLKMEKVLELLSKNSAVPLSHSSIPRMFGVNNNADYPRVSDVYHTISIPQQRILSIYSQEKRFSVPSISPEEKIKLQGKKPLILPMKAAKKDNDLLRPMYRDDIFFTASLTRLPQYTSMSSVDYNLSVTRIPTKKDIEDDEEGCKLCPEAVKRTLATMLDLSLMKSPSFLLLSFGGAVTMLGFYVPFMYLSDRAEDHMKIPEATAVFLISAIGIANTVGRVLCGILSSFPGVNALFVTNAALTVGGIATICSGLYSSVWYQFTYAAIFGLSMACFASLRSIILVDLLGLEKLTNAFGLLLLFQGVAATIGAPLAGAFKEATGSHDASFYLSGGFLLASAVMCYPLNYISRWEQERKKGADKSVPV